MQCGTVVHSQLGHCFPTTALPSSRPSCPHPSSSSRRRCRLPCPAATVKPQEESLASQPQFCILPLQQQQQQQQDDLDRSSSNAAAALGARLVLERLYAGQEVSPLPPLVCLPQVLEQQTSREQQQQQQQQTPSEQGYRGGGSGGDNEERHKQDFFANLGDAIRTLREDIPDLFSRDLNCESRADWYFDCSPCARVNRIVKFVAKQWRGLSTLARKCSPQTLLLLALLDKSYSTPVR